MSNAMRRVANYLGLMDDPEFDTPQTINFKYSSNSSQQVMFVSNHANLVQLDALRQSSVVEVAPQLDLPAMDRIITLHPRYYNEARTIGEHFRQGNPVIINLTEMDESKHKRLVDFASGLSVWFTRND